MRAFSQPPWDSPLAAIEQNSAKDSSLSRISWNRLFADSMGPTSPRRPRCAVRMSTVVAKKESNAAAGVRQQVRRTTPPIGVRAGTRGVRARAAGRGRQA
ncbi:hypothetical protein GCM10009536_12820 [Streptomyces thermocarboxydus]